MELCPGRLSSLRPATAPSIKPMPYLPGGVHDGRPPRNRGFFPDGKARLANLQDGPD